ncbi:hypothetical protein BKN38_04850 [Helicobacter sp. CLO-3]|uniref:hypothetical protein n=1 Tax=unclassified Helicobacter TaxID=2593540 RepID=UPI0008048F7A|nr:MULTISPECIES: hypothetical protein [unclassified Helicobacter]OBV28916.1 hypothetical protein BA723_07530 [Helicobacter sp. CLO-3]OHU83917.1 hypothetical protein BKN38_04850 [Helicobacter sp. CLO-3]
MSRADFLDFIFFTILLYGLVLLIWSIIPQVKKCLFKKDFIRYWSICGILYWILAAIFWKIYAGLKISSGIFRWLEWSEYFLFSIVLCVVSIIYFMIFRFFSDYKTSQKTSQKPDTKYLSKNEKIGVVIASFIHFLISPIPSMAFYYIICRIISFLLKNILGG